MCAAIKYPFFPQGKYEKYLYHLRLFTFYESGLIWILQFFY